MNPENLKRQMIRICIIIANILLNSLIIMILSTVFIINRDLSDGVISGKYFWFYAYMVLFSVTAILSAIIKNRERLNFEATDIFIVLFCVASVLITVNHTGRLTNKCLLLCFLFALYFYLRIFLSDKNKSTYYFIIVFFIFTGLVESIWGLRQLYGFSDSQHNLFKITGSFFNPGPYAGWLAMVFPMALGYIVSWYFTKVNKNKSNEKFVFKSPYKYSKTINVALRINI